MSFGSRLRERREELGLKQSELGKMLGITGSAIGNYENGISSPKADILYQVFSVLRCDANYLFQDEMKELDTDDLTVPEIKLAKKYRSLDPFGKEAVDSVLDVESRRCEAARAVTIRKEREKAEAAQEMSEKIIQLRFKVPGYSLPMSAGAGQEAGQEYPEDYILVKEQPRGTSYIAPVSGDSMEPTYHDGDLLFIHACEEVAVGEIGVFLMDDQQWVKERGEGVLISHNDKYEPIPMREGIRCQGLVLGVCDESYFE